jgi:hypothetical protein
MFFYKGKILLADAKGLVSASIQNGNELTNLKLEVAATGWSPMSLQMVYDEDKPQDKAYLYMTACLSAYANTPYTMNPGYSVTNYNASSSLYSHGTDAYQKTSNFIGRIVIFKFEVLNGIINTKNYSIVYSALGPTVDADFTKEESTWFSNLYGGYSCGQKFYDDQQIHSIKLLKGDNPPTKNTKALIPMDSFVFGIDSLFYLKEKGWKTGLWGKKEENPYVSFYDESGGLKKNILVLGKNYPINSKRLRFVGFSVKAPLSANKLQEPLGLIPVINGSPSYDCALVKCHFMRGEDLIKQYGFPTISMTGELYFLKTWDCYPHITAYHFNRPLYYPRGGTLDLGSCDMRDPCGDISDCYLASIRLSQVCKVLNSSFTIDSGSMKLGVRLESKYYRKLCCGSSFNRTWYQPTLAPISGTKMNYDGPNCDINVYKTPSGSIVRSYFPKTDNYFFIDSLTHQTSLFDVSSIVIPDHRKVPDYYYERLNDTFFRSAGPAMSDNRQFGFWAGPVIYNNKPNPVITAAEKTIIASIKAVDIFRLNVLREFNYNYLELRHDDQKDITITANLDFSAYYYAKMNGRTLIALLDNSYVVTEGSTPYDLRTFIESPVPLFEVNPYAGTVLNMDDATYNKSFVYMSSVDWALYPVIGSHNFHPLDKNKYKGSANLAGVLIYEGYSIKADKGNVQLQVGGLEKYYGGLDNVSTSAMVVKVTRDCEFVFSLRAQTNYCTSATPNQVLHYPDPQYKFGGTIKEDFVVIRE